MKKPNLQKYITAIIICIIGMVIFVGLFLYAQSTQSANRKWISVIYVMIVIAQLIKNVLAYCAAKAGKADPEDRGSTSIAFSIGLLLFTACFIYACAVKSSFGRHVSAAAVVCTIVMLILNRPEKKEKTDTQDPPAA